MPPFLRPRGGGRFQATAMSVGVPLEGTDTVPGLRTLERRAAATRIDGLLNEAAKHGQCWERMGGGGRFLFFSRPDHASTTSPHTQASTPSAATRATVARIWSR